MASLGSVEVYEDTVLGVGSFGKVCKAKSGQLLCAAKLLHNTFFQDDDPGANTLAERFKWECQLLSTIKHPNIVQYLGTVYKSGRRILIMELMDKSLTKFLEDSSIPVPYHVLLNICHDVTLALSFLHSNDIIHRDLSSNNVLLIGDGVRAKVTDFGMSKPWDSCMTKQTQCPGTSVYMPPEALKTPPEYSYKLDVFSYGVLAIQMITRNFPKPSDAMKYENDPNFPTGRILVLYPEAERRKEDIDQVESNHPLLSTILHCIKDTDGERPSANDICEKIASLKVGPMYVNSEENYSARRLQVELNEKEYIINRLRIDHQRELQEKERVMAHLREMVSSGKVPPHELSSGEVPPHELSSGEVPPHGMSSGEVPPHEMSSGEVPPHELSSGEVPPHKILSSGKVLPHELSSGEVPPHELSSGEVPPHELLSSGEIPQHMMSSPGEVPPHELTSGEVPSHEMSSSGEIPQHMMSSSGEVPPLKMSSGEVPPHETSSGEVPPHKISSGEVPPHKMLPSGEVPPHEISSGEVPPHEMSSGEVPPHKMSSGEVPPHEMLPPGTTYEVLPLYEISAPAHKQLQSPTLAQLNSILSVNAMTSATSSPIPMTSLYGSAVVHGDTAYFSQEDRIFSYSISWDQWAERRRCESDWFSLAVVNDELTAVGGAIENKATNILFTLDKTTLIGRWRRKLPPMPTPRILPAAVTTQGHLFVAGGRKRILYGFSPKVEVMNTDTHQWSIACELPRYNTFPHMTSCKGNLYLCEDNVFLSCSVEKLLQSCQVFFRENIWTILEDIPVQESPALVTLRGYVLAIGGRKAYHKATGAIHCYDVANDSWKVIGEMLTSRYGVLAAVLPENNDIVIVGGYKSYFSTCNKITETCAIVSDPTPSLA